MIAALVAEVSCQDKDAVVRVSNEDGGLVRLWSYTLSTVEIKYPDKEKELTVLTVRKKHCNGVKQRIYARCGRRKHL